MKAVTPVRRRAMPGALRGSWLTGMPKAPRSAT
jgi:hypothetical protein